MNQNNNPSKVKLKPIKTVIKKAKRSRPINPVSQTDNRISEMFYHIRGLIIVILFVASTLLIVNIIRELDNKGESTPTRTFISSKTGLLANWKTINGYTFTFEDNSIFHIYESGLDILNNYYEGTYEYVEDEKAIHEMGFESVEEFKTNLNIEDYLSIYSIQMKPQKYYQNNKNIIDRKIGENNKWWFILILTDNDNAIAYNKTLDTRYKLTRS